MDQPLVLIVDDDQDLGEVLVEVLAAEGYHVTLVGSARRALQAIDQARPDIALLDWNLAGGGTDAIAHGLAERGVPIILASGDEQAAETADRIGARAVLRKPFSLDELLSLVRRLVGDAGEQPPSYS